MDASEIQTMETGELRRFGPVVVERLLSSDPRGMWIVEYESGTGTVERSVFGAEEVAAMVREIRS